MRRTPVLKGTLYGVTRLASLMRMASGARCIEDDSATGDRGAAVGKDATGDDSGQHLGAERVALLRGIVGRYCRW